MTQKELEEFREERGLTNSLLFEDPSYDTACIGLSNDDRFIYSYDRMIMWLMENDDMSEEEAIDFISYNTERAIPYFEKDGQKTPIICYDFPQELL